MSLSGVDASQFAKSPIENPGDSFKRSDHFPRICAQTAPVRTQTFPAAIPGIREVKPGRTRLITGRGSNHRGARLLQNAIQAGYVTLQRAEAWKMTNSQKNLIAKRGAIGGRIAVLRLFGLPVPRLKGFSLFRNWLGLPAMKSSVRPLARFDE